MKKMKVHKIALLFFILVLALGGITGCGSKSSVGENHNENGSGKETKKLNIAYQPVVGFLPVYLLKDGTALTDALKKAGYDIEVNFVEFESGPPENEAFATNAVDVGVMGNVPALSGIASGQKRSIIGIAYNGEKTEAVLVGADSDITEVAQLKNKKVGLVVGSIAQNFLSVLLEKNGLSLGDVELVNLSIGEQQEALVSGQIDAVASWEPLITRLTKQGVGKILADGTGVFLAENPIVGRTEYIEKNQEIVKIFLEEYKKAAKEIEENIEVYAKKYADTLGIDAELLEVAYHNGEQPVEIKEEDIADLQGTVEFLTDNKFISKSFDIKDYIVGE